LLAAAFAISLAACGGARQAGPPLEASFNVKGEPAPRSLSDFRGRVVALSLWQGGCAACDQQAMSVNAVAQKLSAQGLVGIVLYDQNQQFALWGLQILHGTLEPAQAAALPKARPVVVLLDREGRVSAQFDKPMNAEELEKELQPLLGL
jgi:thiol-disulfide isomerase/thioredoxin